MSRPMVTGVIGAGAISGIYLKNMIRRFPDLEVKSIASAHMENARKKAEEFGLRAVTVEEMLDDPDIGMVIVLTPVGSHEGLIRQALEHGKHVYTEKTLTDSPETARRLLELADALGQLDEESRNIVLLAVVAGLTSEEIAGITGLSAGGVRSRQSRSLAKMRKYLEGE